MCQHPIDPERPSCRDALMLTRAVFAVVLPALAAIIAVMALLTASLVLLGEHPVLALLPLAGLALTVLLFLRWERGRFRPPEDM